MSSSLQPSSSSTPNFQPIFEKALQEYKKTTGNDLTTQPLAAEIKGCDSPQAVLAVLESKANELNRSRSRDERLIKWLNPTVNILSALSAILGQGAGLVFPPATIILSAIGILLVAAKNTMANRDVLAQLFERIESFFERLKIYTKIPPSPAVTDELAKIMAEVLSILSIATKGMKEGRIKIFLRKVAGINYLEDALQRFGELEQRELLTGIAQVSSDTNFLKDDAKETKAMVKEITEKMGVRNWEEVLQELKRWLSPPDPSTNYNIGLRDLHRDTTTWFLESPIFREWHATGSLLWIHGKPGSGKSILCSAIIHHILSLCDGGRASVAYFYFDFRDDNKKYRHNLLPSLLAQFAAHSIPCCDIISRVHLTHGKGMQQPSDEVMINCLTNILSTTTRHPIYIIMDALDECPDSSGVESPRERVLGLIKYLVGLGLPNLHICTTSRPEMDICNRLEPLTSRRVSLHSQTGHTEDIAKYIRSKVGVIADDKRWRKDDKELVIETLSEKADGMFRWVFCQLEMLRLCLRSRVRHFINELPDSLDETYERVLKGIPKTNRGYAQRLLQCLAVAIRPLRVDELAEILTSDLDALEGESPTCDADARSEDHEQEVLSACPSLITIVGSRGSRVVQFSHFSVKEYLTSDRLSTSSEDISRYRILPDAAHMILAQTSLRVLLRLDDHVERWGARSIPLAEYAAEYWVSHAQVGSVSSRIMGAMKTLFDTDKPHFRAWVRIHNIDGPPFWHSSENTPKPVYYSALCGFYDLVEHLAKKHSPDINTIGGEHDYPLVAALNGGHIRVAELLVRHGAKIDIQGTEERTPLHTTMIQSLSNFAVGAKVGAVQFLLKHGADVNAREMDLSTPLHRAAAQGYFEVVQVLLQHGVDVNCRDVGGETPLHLVPKPTFPRIKANRANLVQLLLENGAEANAQDEDGETPLHCASYFPELELVQMLLDHGADVHAQDNRRQTPLHRVLEAEEYSNEDRLGIVQLLAEHGADVNGQDEDDETPLHFASYFPDLKLVQMLLDHGANINSKGNWGRTPLHRVLEAEEYTDNLFSVVTLLLEHGADVNAPDEDDETPLLLASYLPELKLVGMLLDHGAFINAKDNQGQTPLHRVLEYDPDEDRFGVAQLLIKRGADVNAQDKDGGTPLYSTLSYFPELKLVRMLLDHGADVRIEDNWGRTPLHHMLEADEYSDEDRLGIAQLLIERGTDVNARDEDGETPLHLVSYLPEPKLVRILLDHGANVNAEDSLGQTPLHKVFEGGLSSHKARFSIAQVLGTNVNAEDSLAQTPLRKVFKGELNFHKARFTIATLLVEHGADVNACGEDGETPLLLISYLPELKFVRMLLDHGANVNKEDSLGRTPLHRVLEADNYSNGDCFNVAQLLMERGADVNACDKDLRTPLHSSSYLLDVNFVRLLLGHGANVNSMDNRGRTPLHRVLESDHYSHAHASDVAQLLITGGANVDARDKDDETPLHRASRLVSLELAWILLEHGADLYVKNKEGKVPFQLAQESIREEMKQLPSAYSIGRAQGRSRRAQGVTLMSLLYVY